MAGRVEIDLILKGIKTIVKRVPFIIGILLVEIDLILKGIKTKKNFWNHVRRQSSWK